MRKLVFNECNINLDNGYFFGRGVFETILIKEKPIFLKEHIDRLNNGIDALKLGEKININDIVNIINKHSIKNCVLKIAVSDKNVIIETRENKYKREDYLKGFTLKISNIHRNSKSKLTYVKTLNYLENIIEREEALNEGFNEVLFLNENGLVSEGSLSNVFIVKNNEIFTPYIKTGLLPGIVRNFIINEFKVNEKEISLDELFNADEIFITNSVLGIMGVCKLEDKIFKGNKVTLSVRKRYELTINS